MSTPVHTHVFASHTWKKTNGWKEGRKKGYDDAHVCVCCGAVRSRNRSTLRTVYLFNGQFTVKPPMCEYNGSMANEMERFKIKLPFFPQDWSLERQKEYIDRTGHELPLRSNKTLDELLLTDL